MSIAALSEAFGDEPPPEEAGHPVREDHLAEVQVLGSMLYDGMRGRSGSVREVEEILTSSDFYTPRHALIFDAIIEVVAKGQHPDPLVVWDHLQEKGQDKRAGGSAYLHHLIQSVATSANVTYHAEMVQEQAGFRRLEEVGIRFQQIARSRGEGTIEDIWTRAESEILAAKARSKAAKEKPSTWMPLDLTEILERGDVVDEPAICSRTDGRFLFYRGAVHSVSGEPESGKTWVALMACSEELKNGEHCTFVDFEDRAGRVVGRLLNLGVPKEAIAQRFHYIRPMERLGGPAALLLDTLVVTSTVVVLDGITEAMSLHGLDLNDQKDTATFLHMLPRRLADLGPCVIQIDHVSKNAEEDNRFALGAQHKLAGLDGVAYMVKVVEPFARGKIGRAKVTIAKDREGSVREHSAGKLAADLVLDGTGPEGALLAQLEAPRPVTRSEDGTFRPTIIMAKVSDYLEGATGPLSGGQIEKGVHGKGTLIRDALRVLVAEGYVTSEPGPRNSVLYTSVTPFHDNEGGF